MGTLWVCRSKVNPVRGTIQSSAHFHVHRNQTDTGRGRMTVHVYICRFDDAWAEVSYSTKAANEPISSSSRFSILNSSPDSGPVLPRFY